MIERVLSNLLENALNYTPDGGEVEVRLSDTDDRVRVAVSDTGPGISREDLPHIFDRFFRGDKSRSESDSTGLGLAISQKLVELHGSEIRVESREGEGTTFYFYLQMINDD